MSTLRISMVAVIAAIAWPTAAAATGPIPVEADTSLALPEYVRQVVTGAPADSVVLRVSLCFLAGDGRIDNLAFLVVEELRWPPPPPEYRIDIDGVTEEPSNEDVGRGRQWLLHISRIPGEQLNQVRRALPAPAPTDGSRVGEIGGHWLRPFEFAGWVDPLTFAVDDGRARFVIARVGPGAFELVEVTRWR
jgi:hypothetical protein